MAHVDGYRALMVGLVRGAASITRNENTQVDWVVSNCVGPIQI